LRAKFQSQPAPLRSIAPSSSPNSPGHA
jgi:hypothetical protein